ncbi:Very-short-patch-repair endonuclease [Azospirillum oryzae]|uniref:Very-short-patch-repair endonuclease n=1 Tax=Azospirillum oryzae TaxID=286727 RepID=A0A1X7HEQ3_9PROT|nr:endonuclease domain-containing protein [Azospirillum oryzae]SMF84460.1 Very-short-patch-repair endonuclease [Azospirillum oryzae]
MRDPVLKHRARGMRMVPTDAERHLWQYLRNGQLGGWRFRRQHPIPPYILDFVCLEVCLAVEVDGGQHADSGYDEARTAFLKSRGWRVLRFWNNDVLRNPEGVAASVLEALGGVRRADTCPHPDPPPLGGGGN